MGGRGHILAELRLRGGHVERRIEHQRYFRRRAQIVAVVLVRYTPHEAQRHLVISSSRCDRSNQNSNLNSRSYLFCKFSIEKRIIRRQSFSGLKGKCSSTVGTGDRVRREELELSRVGQWKTTTAAATLLRDVCLRRQMMFESRLMNRRNI